MLTSGSSYHASGIEPLYFSKSGAFNGTGLAIASYGFGNDNGYGLISLYFQHWTGQIRKIQLTDEGTWFGGDDTSIVVTNAKNATPISAIGYVMDGRATV